MCSNQLVGFGLWALGYISVSPVKRDLARYTIRYDVYLVPIPPTSISQNLVAG